eukprot:1161773-Pelagomonas_calceolata.AAC.28
MTGDCCDTTVELMAKARPSIGAGRVLLYSRAARSCQHRSLWAFERQRFCAKRTPEAVPAAVPAPSLSQAWCRSPMQQCLHQGCVKPGAAVPVPRMVQKPDAAVPAPSLSQAWCRSPMQQCLCQGWCRSRMQQCLHQACPKPGAEVQCSSACTKDGAEAGCSSACTKPAPSLVHKPDAAVPVPRMCQA